MRIFVSVVAVFGLWYMHVAKTYASCCVPKRQAHRLLSLFTRFSSDNSPFCPETRNSIVLLTILQILRGNAAHQRIGCKDTWYKHEIIFTTVLGKVKSKWRTRHCISKSKKNKSHLDYSLWAGSKLTARPLIWSAPATSCPWVCPGKWRPGCWCCSDRCACGTWLWVAWRDTPARSVCRGRRRRPRRRIRVVPVWWIPTRTGCRPWARHCSWAVGPVWSQPAPSVCAWPRCPAPWISWALFWLPFAAHLRHRHCSRRHHRWRCCPCRHVPAEFRQSSAGWYCSRCWPLCWVHWAHLRWHWRWPPRRHCPLLGLKTFLVSFLRTEMSILMFG